MATSKPITTPLYHEHDSPVFTVHNGHQSALAAAAAGKTEDIETGGPLWNDNLERVAASICDMGQVQLQLCLDAFRYYDIRDMWLSLPVAVIGSVIATGIAVVQQRSSENPSDAQIVMYVFSAMGILVTIMKIVNSIFCISEKKNKFENVKVQWEKFTTYVSLELYKDRAFRMPVRHFFERYISELVQLQKATPDIPTSVVARFIRLYEGKKGSLQRREFHEMFKPFSFPTLRPTLLTRRLFSEGSAAHREKDVVHFTPNASQIDDSGNPSAASSLGNFFSRGIFLLQNRPAKKPTAVEEEESKV